MAKIKTDGIILDIDGTLWDSTGIVAKAWNRATKESGSKRREYISPDLLKSQFGKPMDEIADNVFPDDTPEMKERIMDLCIEYEQEELTNDPCKVDFPGVVSTIKEMSETIPFYVVSNCQSGYIDLVCEKLGIVSCIRDQECFGDTGLGKAENLRALADRNSLKAPVYIGDTDGDREACEKAGIPFIFASYGFGSVNKDAAAAVIQSFSDIRDLLVFSGT